MTDPVERIARLSPAKRALLTLEMQKRAVAESPREEPIAVIGLGCRFPGARDPEAFWRLLRDGVDAITEVPPDRWDMTSVYDPDPEAPGKMYTRWGGFLDGVDLFDASFFGLTPAEAVNMDPQHRLLLEVAWEALESAGQSPDSLIGSATGIFAGISNNDYASLLQAAGDATRINAYVGTGMVFSAAAGRLSYLLGLQGPSLTLDTACSSSLVAVHLACQSLRQRESDLALAGGVNLILTPETTIYSCRIKVMAADGRCKSFDASADGYVRGEGCGLVVLKRLSDALAAGDPILAVLRGSAVNQDGRSGGLTAPNGLAQQALIRRALENAGLDPAEIDYVEAHGSATPLGDPIEARALGAVLAPSGRAPLPIGSVKSNVGHLESAAGIAGLIKVVLALGNRQIPPSLHFRNPNPNIPFDQLSLRVQRELAPWPAGSGPARAGVSSFGFVGTNAHVVVEEAPLREPAGPSRPWQLLLLSARTASALAAATHRLADHLRRHPDSSLADVAYTLCVGRKSFEQRRIVLCERAEDAVEALEGLDPQRVFTHVQEPGPRSVAFLFPGVGDHYAGMAAGLYEHEPFFRETIDFCAREVEPICGVDLRRVLFSAAGAAGAGAGIDLKAMVRGVAGDDALAETLLSQPAVFAVEYALARLLIEWGVRPQAMIGYSLGELVAACLAGVFSPEDALRLVAHRARLIQELPAGAMLAVPLGAAEVGSRLGEDLSLAAVNGPALTVVSGPVAAVELLERRLAGEGVACRRLQNTHAFHSAMMEPLVGPLTALVGSIELRAPRISYLSNVTGTWITAEQATDPAYWAQHLCRTVRFAEGLGRLLDDPDRILVEVGPGQSLGSFVRQHPACDRQKATVVLPTLRYSYDRQPDFRFLLTTLGRLWLAGAPLDGSRFYAGERRRRVALPTYPFDRQRYWLELPAARPATSAPDGRGLPGKKPDPADWFYRPVWKPAALPVASVEASGSCWLVFVDECGVGDALLDRLRRRGVAAVGVRRGVGFARSGEDSYVLSPGVARDYGALLAELRRREQRPTRIVHLWSVTGSSGGESGDLLARSFHSPLWLAQALANHGLEAPVRWILVSDGVQAVTGREELRPEKATLLGPARVIPQELSRISCRSVDVEPPRPEGPEGMEELLDLLTAEVLAGDEAAVAYRGGRRLVRSFEPVQLEPARAPLRQGGVYLLTGGLGGLGLAVAELLARRAQAKLALVGRSAFPAREEWDGWIAARGEGDPVSRKIRRVLALEAMGAEVLLLTADAADPHGMGEAVERTLRRFGDLHGVVHAAGVPGAGLIQLKTAEAADAVLRPKVAGTLALAAALGDRRLDFLALFSSSTAVAGGFGQVDYCAANAFLDAFAHRQAVAGGSFTVAIDWGPWEWDAWEDATGGSPELLEQHRAMRRKLGLNSAEGTEALERILASGLPQVVVSTADFGAVVDQLERFTAAAALASFHEARRQRPRSARPALGTTYVPAGGGLERRIAEIWQRALGHDEVGIEDNFFDLGGNSLVGMQVVSDLNRELGTEITPVMLFAAPTVRALARAIAPASPAAEPSRAREHTSRQTAPGGAEIAIVGIACRFPQATDVDQYWRLLRDGVEALTHFSDEELAAAGVAPETLANPAYVKVGSVLEGIDGFDAGLFGYSPREAEILDPQQRFFLECAWEALEHAGYDSQRYRGRIGVFAGSNLSTYLFNLLSNPDLQGSVSLLQTVLGNEKDSLTTTASYKLNLRGPSLAVQTFCSTSLVAVHLACRSLQGGESDLVLAGGVRLAVPHRVGYLYEEGGIEPPDGRCRAFDADGKGSVLGNGVGIVVLKRLEDALADGDTIHAVIKGSSINNDGSLKVGYTAPSVEGQALVVEAALEAAGVDPASIGYVEAHGTGTPLGDPVEIAALSRVFGRRPAAAGRLPIGSVKTNFGHLDRAAGVSGLIKAVLALRHRAIPPSLHFERPNPNIDFEHGPFYVNTGLAEWPAGDGPRRACVNSVGMGGTNAHVVLEEAPPAPPATASRPWQLLLLSARTATALEAATARLARHLERHPEIDLADAAYTLQVGRRVLGHRRMLVCRSREEACEALAQPAAGRVYTGVGEASQRPVVFMFPGLGDHYAGMAAGLYRDEPAFRRAFDRCSELLRPHLELDLGELLYAGTATEEAGPASLDLRRLLRRGSDGAAGDPRLRETWLAQPAVFAVEYALAQLLIGWGIRPQAVIGYSLGEYVAACLAGVLSLDSALLLVARRARLISELPPGAMLAVALSESEAAPLAGDELSLAAVNGPALSVWAGPVAAVEALERRLAERGVAASRLQTSHAFHSRMMDPAAGALIDLVATVELSPPCIPYVSNVTGTWITAEEATDPAYWARHMCEAVRFGEGLAELLGEAERVLLEVGPGQALVAFARQHPGWDGDARRLALPTLRHEHFREPDTAFLLGTLGRLWLAGAEADWESFHSEERRRRVALPTYPFEHQRYWIEGGHGMRGAAGRPSSAGKRPDVADWFYLPVWKPSLPPVTPPPAGGTAARWLVLVDERGLGRSIAARLCDGGQRVTIAAAGARFRRLAADEYVVDPRSPQDFETLLEGLDAPPERVVHLWALPPAAPRPSGPELLDDLLDLGFYGLLSFAKAVGRRSLTVPLGIWVVSDQMQKVHGAEELCPEAATLLGPCKVLPQEYLNVTCHSVDVVLPEPGSWQEERLVRQLVAELAAAPADLTVAYRGGDRWVQGFEPAPLAAGAGRPARLRERGVYLITGGLGAIGLTLAERLADLVQARIALLGRSALPPRETWEGWLAAHPEDDGTSRRIRRLQAIEARGAEVLLLAADVANEEEVTRAVSSVYQRFGTLHGVVHAAGVTSGDAFVPVQETGRRECELHFHAKVRGLYVLEKVLRGEDLDFWLLQSSLSAVLGGLGFVAYAAANGFMDAFAHRQNQRGPVPWFSVNWDTWQGGDGDASGFGATIAQFTMSREEGLEAVERILALEAGAQVVTSTGDLGARIAQWIELRSSRGAEGHGGPAHARPQLANPYEAPVSDVERAVAGIWQDVLGIELVGRHDDFFELGGHSLLATQVFSRLRESFRVELPMRSLFEGPTVAGLSGTIETILWAARGGGPPPVALVGEREELEL